MLGRSRGQKLQVWAWCAVHAACHKKRCAICAGIQRRGMNLKAVAPGGEAALSDRARLAHMRSKVMPTQEKFDPIIYLGTVHWVSLI